MTVTAHGDREIIVTRGFDAPRRLVFDACTRPELVKRWLGVRDGWTLPVCEIDLRVGGRYRYLWRHEGRGKEMGSGGVFREIVPPERIVCTELFDDPWYPGESEVTIVLMEQDSGTLLTMTLRYATPEARDTVIKSGMERGLAESYDQMAGVLASLASGGTEP